MCKTYLVKLEKEYDDLMQMSVADFNDSVGSNFLAPDDKINIFTHIIFFYKHENFENDFILFQDDNLDNKVNSLQMKILKKLRNDKNGEFLEINNSVSFMLSDKVKSILAKIIFVKRILFLLNNYHKDKVKKNNISECISLLENRNISNFDGFYDSSFCNFCKKVKSFLIADNPSLSNRKLKLKN